MNKKSRHFEALRDAINELPRLVIRSAFEKRHEGVHIEVTCSNHALDEAHAFKS